jgi:hypothetical protein
MIIKNKLKLKYEYFYLCFERKREIKRERFHLLFYYILNKTLNLIIVHFYI